MRIRSLQLFFAVVMLLGGRVALGQSPELFTKANEQYAAGNFAEAIKLYDSLIQSGETNAAVFYNLGNAHFRAGDLGRAILNYERALALEPHHPEAEANLRLVRDKAHALELRRPAMERALMQLSAGQYSIAAAVSFWIGAFALVALIYSRRRSPVYAIVLFFSFLGLAASIYGIYALEHGSSGRDLAIVTAKSTDARLATADSAGTVLTLPPGSEIKILSTRGEWSYAALPNDLRGWIPAESAERVRL